MVKITITIKNQAEFEGKLKRLGVDLTDFTSELKSAGQDLVNWFSTVPFATKGRVYGQGWQEVTPRRLAYKLKHYPQNAHNTLQATGTMRNSFKFTSTRDLLIIANEVDYFADHQLGNDWMPQRVMMAVARANRQIVIDDIERGIQAKINKVK